MKRIYLLSAILLLTLNGLFAQKITLQNSNKSTMSVKRIDKNNFTVQLSLAELIFSPKSTPEGDFVTISNSVLTKTFDAGNPALPVFSELIEVPQGASVKLTVVSYNETVYKLEDYGIKYQIIPAQLSLSKSDDNQPFSIIRSIYNSNSFFATKTIASFEEEGQMRATKLGRVQINPLQYNPVTNEIKVLNNIVVKVTFENANWNATNLLKQKYASPYFSGITNSFTLNKTDVAKGLITDTPPTYVIVAPDNYSTTLQPFIEWKKLKGFHVIEAYTSITGTTTSAIHDYLADLYNNPAAGVNAPSFVLFVGDIAQIPAYDGTSGSHVTDLYYCDYTNDNIPEVFYGRWSAETTTELQNIIDKTLMYEKYQMPDPSYLNEVFLVAGDDEEHEDTWGNGQLNYGTNNYFNSSNGIYSHTFLQDPAIGNSGVHDSILADISNGVAFANYTAHCSPDGWYSPSFTRNDLSSLTNDGKYGMWIGNCCLSNKFDDDDCFGEIALYSANKGAIGYIGGSNSTYWDEDYWFGVGLTSSIIANPTYDDSGEGAYDGIFHNLANETDPTTWYPAQGQVYVRGNLAVEASSSTRKVYYWEIYHLMGDPSIMNYIGVPAPLTVTYNPSVLMIGSSTVDISSEPYTYVAFTQDDNLIGVAMTDANGDATVNFSSALTGSEVTVVGSCQFHQPYINTLQPISPNNPYVLVSAYTPDSADYSTSNIDIDVDFVNVAGGSYNADNVNATASTTDPYITISGTTATIGLINAGDTVSVSSAFTISVADSVPDGHKATINITITGDDAKYTWNSTMKITLNAPKILIGNIFITNDDDASGILDPNETGDINFTIKNTGNATATFNGILSESNDPNDYLTLAGTSVTNVTLAPDSSAIFSFTGAKADSLTPLGSTVGLKLNITAGNTAQYQDSSNQNLVIGIIPIYPISDEGTLSVCTGTFYDSGLDAASYDSNEDYTMTFLPPSGQDFVVVNFSSFDIENNYDFLYVYDGADATATEIPGSPFTGTDSPGMLMGANGLTFNFVSDGSVNHDGWEAEVSCFTATEPPACATNPVPTNNSSNVFPINLTWDNSMGATGYKVYFGTDTDPYSNNADTVTSANYNVNVDANTTYYWAVTPYNNIGDTSGCEVWTFTTGAPFYNMTNGTVTTCSGNFYDDGGINGEYSSHADYTMTFYPATAGAMLKFTFNSFSTEDMSSSGCYDELAVYDGTSTSSTLIGEYCDNNPISEVTATNTDGALTFVFSSDGSVQQDGWNATIECVTDTTVNIVPVNQGVKVYPNPTTSIVNVNLSNVKSNNADIEIYSANGKMIYKKSTSDNNTQIDLSSYNKGIYMIKVISKDYIYLDKVILK